MDDDDDDDLFLSRHAWSKTCLSFLTVSSSSFVSTTVDDDDDDDDSRNGLTDSAFRAVGSRADVCTRGGENAVVDMASTSSEAQRLLHRDDETSMMSGG